MFGTKPQAEPESDSDWDSIPGDVADEPSSQEPTPRYNPAPPPATAGSPRRTPAKPQTATAASGRSLPQGSSSAKDVRPGTAPISQRPSQIYGKPVSVTTFTDKSPGITSFVDRSQLSTDVNANRGSNKGHGKREQSQIDIEMNDVDFQPSNPPFTDFKDSLAEQNVSRPTRNERNQKQSRPKSPYTHVTKTPTPPEDSDNNSWDESVREQPVSDSRQQLTDRTPRGHKSNKNKPQEHVLADSENGAIQQSCCVPLEGERQLKEYSYYFHHGHNDHLSSSPEWRQVHMKIMADRSEKWLQYFWQEFFSVLRIILDFAFIFFLELFRFILRYVLLRVLAGVVMVVGDHLLKPSLTVLFNSFVQPLFVFTWNFFTGFKNVLRPVLDVLREVVLQCATLLRAFRLFELTWKPSYHQENSHDVRDI